MQESLILDAVIIGGGAAGLWTLDRLVARGFQVVLLEAHELGSGQTIASQGIIHGGLKYTLSGMLTPSAKAIREMPRIWRECLAGQREPKLTKTVVRSECCYLWRTESIASRVGMIGARFGLRTASNVVAEEARPIALVNCPGTVARVDEQVIDARSFIADLAERHHDRIVRIEFPSGFDVRREGATWRIGLRSREHFMELIATCAILSAGGGNDALRQQFGIASIMQRRPLHMVMVRGRTLPPLFGHCVDGAKTRVTITSATDSAGRTVWQIGGQVAEDGVNRSLAELIQHAKHELNQTLAGFDLGDVVWATYRVDRAEHAAVGRGARPDDVSLVEEFDGSLMTVWPTKLALAPRAAEEVLRRMVDSMRAKPQAANAVVDQLKSWPRPRVAQPPWETITEWSADA